MKGIIPPVVTLLDENGAIDVNKNKQMLDFLIKKGVHGILLLGSSGEFPHFSLAEKKAYLDEIVPYIRQRVPVLVGTGGTVLEETIDFSNYAAQLGVAGVLVVNPYYWPLTDEQLYSYFSEVAENIETDLYLYNIPQLTGQDIPISVIKKLAQNYKTICGIKETVATLSRIREIITEVAEQIEHFEVYSAYDEHLLDAQLSGAAGSINGSSVFLPEFSVALYDAIQAQNFELVKELHGKMTKLMEIYKWHPSFYLTMKIGVHERLFKGTPIGYRKPFIVNSDELVPKVSKIIEETFSLGGVR